MEVTIKGKPSEISFLLRSIKGIVANDPLTEQLNIRIGAETPNSIKHIIDKEAVNELIELAHYNRKEGTL